MASFTVENLSARVGGTLVADGAAGLSITGVERLDAAGAGQLTFIGDDKHARRWPDCRASAALVSAKLEGISPGAGRALIRVSDADLAMATILELFAPPAPLGGMPPTPAPVTSPHLPAIHPTAVIDPTAVLGVGVRIGACCVVGPRVSLGDRVTLYPNVTILDDTRLGDDCTIWSGTVIRDRCTLGRRCTLHSNVTIGADGFGYRPSPDGRGLVKIPQIGTVEIGNDVEIGAGSCIDRGKFSATVIGDGTKIDNLCQVGHNCRLGRCVILVGQVGLSGSVTVGDGAMLGGKAGVADHVTIGAGAVIAAFAAVMNDVPPGETWGGMPAQPARLALREIAAIRKLPDFMKKYGKDG